MNRHNHRQWQHDHQFSSDNPHGEKNTIKVIILTVFTAAIEISAGLIYGSMALLADGWHMGSHTVALGITAFTYSFARRHRTDNRYSFGTGKVGSLGGFASAMVLAVVALIMVAESLLRLFHPEDIRFTEAIMVAILGLSVNLLSALMLHSGHGHDHNLKAAYLHVLADALTSILAIFALLAGRLLDAVWLDPLMGIVGAVIILKWSAGLIRESGHILLDREITDQIIDDIRTEIEADGDSLIADMHVWRLSSEKLGCIVSVITHSYRPPDYYKAIIARHSQVGHITIEVNVCKENCSGTEPP